MGELSLRTNSLRLLQYLLFWGISIRILAGFFSHGDTIENIDWVYTILFLVSLWFGVAVNSFLLIPKLLAKGRVVWYLAVFLMLLVSCIWLNQFTFDVLSGLVFPHYFFISYYSWVELLYFFIAFLGLTSLLQFSRSWFREMNMKRELAEMEQQKALHELQALKHNIQPHFLFNSLNAIYVLINKKSEMASEAVLMLSDLLRYTIKQSEKDLVLLDDEAAYIENYISLQKLRMNRPEQVVYTVKGQMKGTLIVPLMLIIFVENCFKYADLESSEPVNIELDVTDDEISFRTCNPVDGNYKMDELPDNSQGTGLSGVRKRLELHYPDQHHLLIKETDKRYEVNLKIKKNSQ